MALVRILVNGYGLLHRWPTLAPGKPRESEVAREELINHLTQFFDTTGTPITVVFDGATTPMDAGPDLSTEEVDVQFSRVGQSADQSIERQAHKAASEGDILIVSDSLAVRNPFKTPRTTLSTFDRFVQTVETTLADLKREIQKINQQEKQKFSFHG